MTFKEYQEKAIETLTHRQGETHNELLARLALGITGEAGEIAEKVKKWLRGDYNWDYNKFKQDIRKEIGDLLWYIAVLTKVLFFEFCLGKIAQENLDKLADRKKRNKIKGSGDNR